jgi:acyl-CoA synthetase (AMP-forming)/AMP-acid ligase II
MISADPIVEELMAPGGVFEVVSKGSIRVFKNSPKSMGSIFDQARKFGETEFLVSGDIRLSFDDIFGYADGLSLWLTKEITNIKGKTIAICMKNQPEWMIAFIAIINAGGIAVLINSRGKGETMLRAVNDTNCVYVIGDKARLDALFKEGYKGKYLSADNFPEKSNQFKAAQTESDDIACMFFTSGTTGVAKAAVITHGAFISGVMNTQMAMAVVLKKMALSYGIDVESLKSQMPQSGSLLIFPLFHTSGCSAVFMTALINGGKLVIMDKWNPDKALSLIEKEKISNFGGVPTMYWDLLRSPVFKKFDLSSLVSVSCGGQALPINLLNEIHKSFPKAFIGAGYGMTETCGAISQAVGDVYLANPSAAGQILPMFDVQITSENGNKLPIGEVGEIWVKGATLMQGYFNRPKETLASMSGDWFKTGDVGKIDNQGYLYIVDRRTDMVISGGENIYCAEIEQVLGRQKNVLAICAYGIPHERLGEALVVRLYVKNGLLEKDILNFAKKNLAKYKIPEQIIIQNKPFELNAMGKIEKNKVREIHIMQLKKKQKQNDVS